MLPQFSLSWQRHRVGNPKQPISHLSSHQARSIYFMKKSSHCTSSQSVEHLAASHLWPFVTECLLRAVLGRALLKVCCQEQSDENTTCTDYAAGNRMVGVGRDIKRSPGSTPLLEQVSRISYKGEHAGGFGIFSEKTPKPIWAAYSSVVTLTVKKFFHHVHVEPPVFQFALINPCPVTKHS